MLSRTPDPSFGAPPVTFTYTATFRRATMTDPSGTTTYTYTNRDQVATKTTPEGTLSYTYDVSDNVVSVLSSNANGMSVGYAWDADNRLSSVTDNRTNGVTNYTYDATNQVQSFTYPNGITHSLHIRQSRSRLGTRAWPELHTRRRSASQAVSKALSESNGRTSAFTYDPLYRLLSENITGVANNGLLTYTLDAVGNRTALTSTLTALQSQSFTYDDNDRISGDTFDNNGNTTSSDGVTYTYDFEDRPVSTASGLQMVYDGDGNLVAETVAGVTRQFLVDELTPTGYAQIVEELVSGSVTAQYTHGLMRINQRRSGLVSYYGYDPGGSTRQLFDSTGAATDTYAYDAFGNIVSRTGSTTNEFLHRGERFDSALGMYYLRARYYIPRSGRFLTADKYEGEGTPNCNCAARNQHVRLERAHHLFRYTNSDPVNFLDRSGHGDTIFTYFIRFAKPIALGTLGFLIYEELSCPLEDIRSISEAMDTPEGPVLRVHYPNYGCLMHEHQEPPEYFPPEMVPEFIP